jgi:hypothetical protein
MKYLAKLVYFFVIAKEMGNYFFSSGEQLLRIFGFCCLFWLNIKLRCRQLNNNLHAPSVIAGLTRNPMMSVKHY